MGAMSSFLYADPSFVDGAARVFDWGNVLNEYNESLNPEQADYLALRMDWRVVGKDIREAVDRFAVNVEEER